MLEPNRAKPRFLTPYGLQSPRLRTNPQHQPSENISSDLDQLEGPNQQEVDDFDLNKLYRDAKAVIFPSLSEGFGLPLVESLSVGTPVIASDIPVFRETGKDAVLYFSLLDDNDLKEKIRDLLSGAEVPTGTTPLHWKDSCNHFYKMLRNSTYQNCYIPDTRRTRFGV